MRIAATWKSRWSRVTSARMVMRRDRVLPHRSWSITKSIKLVRPHENGSFALLKLWRFLRRKKQFITWSFRESNTTVCLWTELDTGDSTESFCRSRDCDVYLFQAKLSVTEWKSRWRLGPCGCFSSAFRRLEQDVLPCSSALLWIGKGKAVYGRHGSGALCMTKLSCMTIEELTNCRESLHVDSRRCSLWGLWTVSRECHEILQNCPSYKGQKIDDYVQHFHESNNGMCACVRAQTTW